MRIAEADLVRAHLATGGRERILAGETFDHRTARLLEWVQAGFESAKGRPQPSPAAPRKATNSKLVLNRSQRYS